MKTGIIEKEMEAPKITGKLSDDKSYVTISITYDEELASVKEYKIFFYKRTRWQ